MLSMFLSHAWALPPRAPQVQRRSLPLQREIGRDLPRALATLSAGLVERSVEAKLLLLAVLAGEHLLLLGPPGSGKSQLAARLQLLGLRHFQRLLTRFTTIEDVFGPMSLAALERDELERKVQGFLPDAESAFLDEVFNAGSGLLNALLTLLNERRFWSSKGLTRAPLWCLVAASNGAPDLGLESLYDRFLLRRWVSPISDAGLKGFLQRCLSRSGRPAASRGFLRCREVKAAAGRVEFPPRLLHLLPRLRQVLQEWYPRAHISDRRLVKAARLGPTGHRAGRTCFACSTCFGTESPRAPCESGSGSCSTCSPRFQAEKLAIFTWCVPKGPNCKGSTIAQWPNLEAAPTIKAQATAGFSSRAVGASSLRAISSTATIRVQSLLWVAGAERSPKMRTRSLHQSGRFWTAAQVTTQRCWQRCCCNDGRGRARSFWRLWRCSRSSVKRCCLHWRKY
ncbi:unnamed protein product [Effrenium voratum]|uniref:AAA+ ATPase domain-containing protein n=1 Tax=Effrenium voratum TaxID=2562239 RepID=A0AA36NN27_9DINO|nr:unnamed protein product [Effrenium voratum]